MHGVRCLIAYLDVYTLIFVLVMGHALSLIMLFAATRQKADNGTNDYIFIFGRVSQLVAWILIGERGGISEYLSLMVGNTFLLIGHALEAVAFTCLKIASSRKVYMFYGILTGGILLCGWSVSALWPVHLRIALTLPLVGLLFLIPGCLLVFSHAKTSLLQKIIGVMYIGCFFGALWRAWLISKLNEYSLFLPHIVQKGAFLVLICLLVIGSIGYILIKKEYIDLELEKMANTDFLTGLCNRRAFFQLAQKQYSLARRKNMAVSLLILDIDYFKKINDHFGHQTGDLVLRQVASTLRASCRDYDIICRFGGEEFVVLLPGTTYREAEEVAERLRTNVAASRLAGHDELSWTVSIGGVTLEAEADECSLDTLVGFSDKALYEAKTNGRNRVVFFTAPAVNSPYLPVNGSGKKK